MKKTFTLAAAVAFSILTAGIMPAQSRFDGVAEFESTVHDFGDIFIANGPVSHSFTVKNISSKDMTVLSVVSSCGCTDVDWTRTAIKPGKTGQISATYSNDEGPYSFDKTLTVYIAEVKKPVVLHLRGVSHEAQKPLEETYPVHFGSFAMREADIKAGNMSQGEQKNGQTKVANIGKSPIKIEFKNVSDGLSIKVEPNPVPAGGTATLIYNIESDREHWGKNYYYATPVVDGKEYKAAGKPARKAAAPGSEALVSEPNPLVGEGCSVIGIWSMTKENFSSLSKEEKRQGPTPMFESTNFQFGKVKAGKTVTATFNMSNNGKQTLKVYKADSDTKRAVISKINDVPAGGKGTVTVRFDTAGLPKGEVLVLVNLITNSPSRPLVSLYITGIIN